MNKSLWYVVLVFMVMSVSVFGMETEVGLGVVDKYLGERTSYVFDERTSVQSSINIEFENGVFGNVWNNTPIGDEKDGCDGNEIDFTVGWSGDLKNPFSIETAIVYYECAPIVGKSQDGNYWAPYLKVSGKSDLVSGYLRLEIAIPDGGTDDGMGMLVTYGVENEYELTEFYSVQSDLYITFDDGAYGGEANQIVGYSGGLQYATGNMTLTLPNVLVTVPIENEDSREFETAIGASVSYAY